ncbi:Transketolase-like [Aphelenchoides avenae]|nr:Transketolase-like [Aphelenchus avenae]
MLIDQNDDRVHIPLNHLAPEQKSFLEIANSPLSEEAILAFEYGFSTENPRRLVIWEAQFGDFYNVAQTEIDTLIATGESKWLLQCGLVMLLPHGFDGAGPDHSSCHMERFLQITDSSETQQPADGDNVNMHVVNPTTSAQYFHLLRRQVVTPYRKPLIVVAPKILLRHPSSASPLSAFAPGTHFRSVILDETVKRDAVKRVIFVSGKHAYLLLKERDERKLNDTAIVRLEGICPFPVEDIRDAVNAYPNAGEYVWSQEEPRNAGCWSFVSPRFKNALGIELRYAGRPELAHTATAIGELHEKEAKAVIASTFGN